MSSDDALETCVWAQGREREGERPAGAQRARRPDSQQPRRGHGPGARQQMVDTQDVPAHRGGSLGCGADTARVWTDLEHTTRSERCRTQGHTLCDPIYVTCPEQVRPRGQSVGEWASGAADGERWGDG